ncbi:MAG: cytochrome c peroxidase, partial [Planctomycetota bacterium]
MRRFSQLVATVSLGALVAVSVGCPSSSETGGGSAAAPDYDAMPLGLDKFARKGLTKNPITHEKVVLGKHLYFDKRLSADNTISCATCHDPAKGWTDQAAVSTGIKGQKGGRSAPTVINRVFSGRQFWDGREPDLEGQAKGPLTNPIEMGMKDHAAVVAKLEGIAGYKPLFKAAFGDEKIDIDRVAQAIATFERTIVSGNSPYDKAVNGDASAMSAAATKGKELFFGKAKCTKCHIGANFTDELYHNLGVGADTGLEQFTKDAKDRGKFKTPTLRQITESGPYMHDGSEKTLLDVVKFYNKGGNKNPNLDKEMVALNLTDEEMG